MTPGAERPPVTTAPNASGTWNATLEGDVLTYSFTFTGLTSNTTLAHIHGPGGTEVSVGVLVDFNAGGRTFDLGVTSGDGSGTVNVAAAAVITAAVNGDSLRKLLDNGNAYVNVHTVNNGPGEIRGQIVRQ